MRVLVQRVTRSEVIINQGEQKKIGHGLLILLGIEDADTKEDVEWLCGKISKLRVFDDENGVMNRSVLDVEGEAMVISQFTLHASTKKNNRPSYIRASKPEVAIPLYEQFVKTLEGIMGKEVKTGVFGAHMDISLTNNGPVTIWIDSKNKE